MKVMSEIIDNKLFLGSALDANNEKELQKRNVNCVICVAEDIIIKLNDPSIKVYKYNIQDDYDCDISLYFDEIGKLIETEKKVLVNCFAGISRSATITIAYLMKYRGLNLKEALVCVRDKRSIVCPNKKFLEHLFKYEKNIFGKNSSTWNDIVNLCYYS